MQQGKGVRILYDSRSHKKIRSIQVPNWAKKDFYNHRYGDPKWPSDTTPSCNHGWGCGKYFKADGCRFDHRRHGMPQPAHCYTPLPPGRERHRDMPPHVDYFDEGFLSGLQQHGLPYPVWHPLNSKYTKFCEETLRKNPNWHPPMVTRGTPIIPSQWLCWDAETGFVADPEGAQPQGPQAPNVEIQPAGGGSAALSVEPSGLDDGTKSTEPLPLQAILEIPKAQKPDPVDPALQELAQSAQIFPANTVAITSEAKPTAMDVDEGHGGGDQDDSGIDIVSSDEGDAEGSDSESESEPPNVDPTRMNQPTNLTWEVWSPNPHDIILSNLKRMKFKELLAAKALLARRIRLDSKQVGAGGVENGKPPPQPKHKL
jgi:hypothetical protein